MFKWLFKFHIYGGLFCSLYFLIAGITALNFQHHFLNSEETEKMDLVKTIRYDHSLPDEVLAAAIADSMGYFGHIAPWNFRTDSSGIFSYAIHRPGCRCDIRIDKNSDTVRVCDTHTGFANKLSGMHTSIMNMISFWPMQVWSYYAQAAAVIGFIVALISIYFWFRKSVRRRSEWIIAGVSVAASLFLILLIWLAG